VIITSAENGSPIVYVNKAFSALTGDSATSVIGKSPAVLQGPATERAPLEALHRCMQEGKGFEGRAINYDVAHLFPRSARTSPTRAWTLVAALRGGELGGPAQGSKVGYTSVHLAELLDSQDQANKQEPEHEGAHEQKLPWAHVFFPSKAASLK
jgi:hypothetical protein